jgi:hypothetical protein
MSTLKIPTAKIFEPLLRPARYKGIFGGRGSGKSHFFGELLIELCESELGTSAVCIRESQKTLAQSSKRLIESKIEKLGLSHRFRLYSDRIATPGGFDQITGRLSHRLDRRGAILKRTLAGAAAADDPRSRFRAVGVVESQAQG